MLAMLKQNDNQKKEEKPKKQKRQFSRKMLTFGRVIRYGVSNFRRNAWLTMAATVVMTMTLSIIFISLIARNVMLDTVNTLKDKVDMSIYLKTDTPSNEATAIQNELKQLKSVTKVTYISPEEGRNEIVQENSDSIDYLNAINEATNEIPGTLRVKIVDIDNTSELQSFVKNDVLLKKYISSDFQPSFAGSRKASIESIGKTMNFIEKAGVVLAVFFVIISFFVIYNTIRMAIFNRKDEIYMMQLIGADQSFIRGPFLVEASMYGCIAAVIATIVGYVGIIFAKAPLNSYSISVDSTYSLLIIFLPVIIVTMLLLGIIIGCISSYFATKRYLKL
jgi:cell division transport system permease protein